MAIPRPEYPRPQFARTDWLNLNGEWEFEIDQGDSGLDRGLLSRTLNSKITVPFCPESELSGVYNRDYLEVVWYRKQVEIPAAWGDKKVLLHFQAVDYDTTVWANGVEVGRHRGGSTPFQCDLSKVAKAGETVTIVVRARDSHTAPQPRGKQSRVYGPFGPIYYRTTGIWQTVWLEPIPAYALKRPRLTPDVGNSAIHLVQPLTASKIGLRVRATLKDDKGEVVTVEAAADQDFAAQITLPIPADRRRLWSIHDPFLYDLNIQLLDGDKVIDQATSYAGLRSVTIEGKAVKINGEIIFQRLVLDQGYYPDGILTAPNDEALKHDIELSMQAGFNGARLHQKVFEERFLYYADKLGYLVWGEFPDWGVSDGGNEYDHQRQTASFITEWLEELERDYSHPAIIGWCPLNETWQTIGDKIVDLDVVTRGMFLAAKAMDTTRPVLDTSGYSHRIAESDVYDSHDYEQDIDKFRATHAGLADEKPYLNTPERRWYDRGGEKAMSIPYGGQPYFVSEFGGIWWNPNAKEGEDSWGYGNRPKNLDEFYARFKGLFDVLLDDPKMFGYCYTQLTDVYQEQNGIYTFDRQPKFDMDRIRAIQQKQAAIEKGRK